MPIIEYESQRQSFNEDEVIEQFAELIRRSEKAKTNQNLRSVIAKLKKTSGITRNTSSKCSSSTTARAA